MGRTPPAVLSRHPGPATRLSTTRPGSTDVRRSNPAGGAHFGIEPQCLMNRVNSRGGGEGRWAKMASMVLGDATRSNGADVGKARTPPPRAAILLIGNELLSGKVEEQNARYLVRELRELGVVVSRIEVIPDDAADIAATARHLSERFDLVFSSGGVGPTHDDVTLPAMAAAFGMSMVRSAELEALL